MKVDDNAQAKDIAIKFLEQYNSSITFRSAVLENETWVVLLDVGLVKKQTRRVLIDRLSGNILSHNDYSDQL